MHYRVKPHCRRKVRLSRNSATVAGNGEIRRLSHFSATVWTGFNVGWYRTVFSEHMMCMTAD